MEVRSIPQEMKQEGNTIEGYAILFNEESRNLGDFVEVISPDALRNVDFSDTKLLFQHDIKQVLGRTSAGTLQLKVTERGLHFKADLPKTTLGNDVKIQLERRDLRGMSFSMTVLDDQWNLEAEPILRNINRIGKVNEISIVTDPAYEKTSVSQRALDSVSQIRCLLCHEANEINQTIQGK